MEAVRCQDDAGDDQEDDQDQDDDQDDQDQDEDRGQDDENDNYDRCCRSVLVEASRGQSYRAQRQR